MSVGLVLIAVALVFSTVIVIINRKRINRIHKKNLSTLREIQEDLKKSERT
jgi:uncharacterized protein YoxC